MDRKQLQWHFDEMGNKLREKLEAVEKFYRRPDGKIVFRVHESVGMNNAIDTIAHENNSTQDKTAQKETK